MYSPPPSVFNTLTQYLRDGFLNSAIAPADSYRELLWCSQYGQHHIHSSSTQ